MPSSAATPRPRMRSSRAKRRIRISIWRASARASRIRRSSAGWTPRYARQASSSDSGRAQEASLLRHGLQRLELGGGPGGGRLGVLGKVLLPGLTGEDVEVAVGDHPVVRIRFALHAARQVHRAQPAELRRVLVGIGLEQVAVPGAGEAVALAVEG